MAYLKQGKWKVDTIVDGVRRQKTFPTGTPKKVVEDFERRLKLKAIDPKFRVSEVPTVKDFGNEWLERVCKIEKSHSTYVKCRQILRSQILPRFKDHKLHAIHAMDVVNWQRDLASVGYAVQSINNTLACLSSIYKEAVARELVSQNPVSGIKRMKRVPKDIQIWTIEEKNRFLATVRDEQYATFQLCLFALCTGLRPMELRGLLREDVDYDLGLVRVRRQWCSKQNKLVDYTKTRQSRTVPVPKDVLKVLADKRGFPMTAQMFPQVINSYGHRYLKPLMRKAQVREIRLHDFRHTFASHLLMLGADIMQVKELLGHRKLESTMIYLHLIPGRIQGATDRLTQGVDWLGGEPAKVVQLRL